MGRRLPFPKGQDRERELKVMPRERVALTVQKVQFESGSGVEQVLSIKCSQVWEHVTGQIKA